MTAAEGHPYAGAAVALLTRHGKERVIAPVLADALGCQVRHVGDYDTDLQGTFTVRFRAQEPNWRRPGRRRVSGWN